MSAPISVHIGPWRAEWGGGRLADVFHLEYEHALHCIQIGEYDDTLRADDLARARAGLGPGDVHEALEEFIEQDGATYLANA